MPRTMRQTATATAEATEGQTVRRKRGRPPKKRIPTVSEWFADPRCDYVRNPASPATKRIQRKSFEKHIEPEIGDIPLNQVTGKDLERIYAAMEVRPYSPNSIFGVYSILAMAFSAAVRHGLIRESPCVGHTYIRQLTEARKTGE